MKILRVLAIFTTFFLIDLLSSCDGTCNSSSFRFTHCDLEVQNLDNANAFPVISSADTIESEVFGLRLDFTRKIDVCNHKFHGKGIFISSAYADECIPESYYAIETIEDIQVLTLNDFSSSQLAGSDISSVFKTFYNFGGPKFSNSIEELLTNRNLSSSGESGILDRPIDLLLNTVPITGEQQFKVLVLLSDGRVLESVSKIVVLK